MKVSMGAVRYGKTESLVAAVPQLARGVVWCTHCGQSQRVESIKAMAFGWPLCCGSTMTLDSPEERAARRNG